MENTLDRLKRDFVMSMRLAHARRQNEAQNAATSFFVGTHRLH